MNYSSQYVQKLEEMIINHLMPAFNKYYTGKPFVQKPELDVLVLSILERKQAIKTPAIFKVKRGVGVDPEPRRSKK